MRRETHDLAELIDDRPNDEHFAYHRSALTSEDIHRLELEHIFMRTWLYLGHESEVPEPGDFVRRSVAGQPLFMVRSRTTGHVRVFANTCTHRGATICRRDRGNAKAFQCFYHAWTFNTDGNLVGVPDESAYGGAWDKDAMGLRPPARAESYRGFVFVSFSHDVPELRDHLAGARACLDDLMDASAEAVAVLSSDRSDAADSGGKSWTGPLTVLRGTHQYGIKANWKLLVENSFDGYHLAPTHHTYFQFLKDQDVHTEPSVGSCRQLGNGHAVLEYTGSWGRPVAKWSPAFGEDSHGQLDAMRDRLIATLGDRGHRMAELNRNLFIYPNLFVMDNNALALRVIQPTGVGYMDVAQYELAPRDEDAGVRRVRLESYVTFAGPGGLATPDDVEALESCQAGADSAVVEWNVLSRAFHDDRMTGEAQLREFWRRWQSDLMASELAEAQI
ncbi:aromatic ring-hydroxylating oxygenase subunit alpha [Capillimicrobium parvum]|uniref:p-cumate 2,3-dioxygenase system, large oxygenase component n=1 Tax=Capillimicrobium parvum TaxID=2884022 RepID=A0A9E7C142_9ACTN|nr:aromatic ring-hydroxylating dioxygenase subunit alpha [Capillimicrobium parvum]UGS36043.1 p-cumate 2,3-dioxygenase system, large oxygenase component [Capillimicrobium parvum]